MNQLKYPLTASEKYVLILMYLIGGVFLILQIVSFVSTKSKIFNTAEGMININRNELLSLLRVVTTIILSFAGAILFTKGKSSGWSINLAVLIFFTLLLGSMLYANFNTPDLSMGIGIFLMLLMGLGIVFLLLRRTRAKYKASSASLLVVAALLAFLLFFYIYLQ